MDINALVASVYHSPAAMLAIGLATAHAGLILHYVVLAVFKVPALRAWLVGNPAQAKAALAALVAEVDADIDALQPPKPASVVTPPVAQP